MMNKYYEPERHISIHPIDVGFDLRITEHDALIPWHTDSVSYDLGGEKCIAHGTLYEIQKELEKAGYTVALETPGFKHEDLDGRWNQILPNGMLEMRDPNAWTLQTRYQYQGGGKKLWFRQIQLSHDDWFNGPGSGQFPEPWKQCSDLSELEEFSPPILEAYARWAIEESAKRLRNTKPYPRYKTSESFMSISVERSIHGREILFNTKTNSFEVQPRNETYWVSVDNLDDARLCAKNGWEFEFTLKRLPHSDSPDLAFRGSTESELFFNLFEWISDSYSSSQVELAIDTIDEILEKADTGEWSRVGGSANRFCAQKFLQGAMHDLSECDDEFSPVIARHIAAITQQRGIDQRQFEPRIH